MKLFKFTSKDKNGNRECRLAYIDGIPNLFKLPGEMNPIKVLLAELLLAVYCLALLAVLSAVCLVLVQKRKKPIKPL